MLTAILHRRYLIALGRGTDCGAPVRVRRAERTSAALAAAGTMLRPRAMAQAAWLYHGCGMSATKVSKLFACVGPLVTAAGITLPLERIGIDAEHGRGAQKRAVLRMSPDETGWRVDAERGWLWTFVGDKVTGLRRGGRGQP